MSVSQLSLYFLFAYKVGVSVTALWQEDIEPWSNAGLCR